MPVSASRCIPCIILMAITQISTAVLTKLIKANIEDLALGNGGAGALSRGSERSGGKAVLRYGVGEASSAVTDQLPVAGSVTHGEVKHLAFPMSFAASLRMRTDKRWSLPPPSCPALCDMHVDSEPSRVCTRVLTGDLGEGVEGDRGHEEPVHRSHDREGV